MTLSDIRHDNEWLTLSQASELLGVHPATLRQWSDEGKISLFRTPGGHRRFARAEVQRLLHVLPVRGPGLSAFVATESVQRTREEMAHGFQSQAWLQHVDPAQRERLRIAGRQLVNLAAQIAAATQVSDAHRSAAASLGQTYGELLREAGLELPDAVLAFLFFRDSLLETIFQLPSTTGLDRAATLQTVRRINSVLNEVLRVMMEAFVTEQSR